ncbi:MFS transporter [Thermaerobacter sp. PB12/4term]|uniref:MFS transporter n=1 Tax=Thermaerobacter sp. PB12/4term TaxID=2293838 RepID=UPI000E3283D5|nr:MFS transporter [Thermaerobacter sp. PB12/4term]QIA27525.1 MFS transporter [Thermaerobacter sp. PB12/4term]
MHRLLYVAVMAAFFDQFSQMPLIAPYTHRLGVPSFLAGLIVGAYSLTNLAGNLAAGRWLDGGRRKGMLVLGLALAALGAGAYAPAETAAQLALARLVHGFGAGLVTPAAFALLGDRSESTHRGQVMAGAGAAIGLAAVVGPAYGGLLAQRLGPGWVFATTAALLFLVAMVVARWVRDEEVAAFHGPAPRTGQAAGDGDMAAYGNPALAAAPAPQGSSPFPARSPARGRRPAPEPGVEAVTRTTPLWRNAALRQAYLGALALMFAMGLLVYTLPAKAAALSAGPAATGMLLSLFGFTAIALFLSPASRLSDRWGRARPLLAGLMAVAAALAGLAALRSLPGLALAMVAFGTGFALVFPAAAALVVDATGRGQRGRAFGLFYACFSVAVMGGSAAAGALGNPTWTFLAGTAAVGILAVLLAWTGRALTGRASPAAAAGQDGQGPAGAGHPLELR